MASNWAIVIGINDYLHHPERKLNYAVNDAQQMGKFLSDRAGFDAEQVIQCLGDQAHRNNATYPTCDNLLQLLKRDLKPDRLGKIDRLWFYFSGHGVSRDGRDYLITSNCLEDEIDRFALPIDEVIAALQLHKDAEIVLILDACRQVLGKKNFDNPIGEETIATAREGGITTIFSCDYGQYSYELEALKQGAFTYALIEGFAQHTLPHQLETYLCQRVPDLHSQYRRDRVIQTPRIRIDSASKAFQPLLPDAVTPTDIAVLADRATKAELDEDFEMAKQLWWQIIESPQSSNRIREARTAIDRINRKTARTINKTGDERATVNPPAQNPPQPSIIPESPEVQRIFNDPPTSTRASASAPQSTSSERLKPLETHPESQPLTRQQFLKWAIPAGAGVAVVTIFGLGQLLVNSPPVDYSTLEGFLKVGQWKEADQETINLMSKVANREQEGWLDSYSIQTLRCDVLNQIDRLWIDNSGGNFGFSVQKKIYEDCGGKPNGQYVETAWFCFADAVGWRVNNQWISYADIKFDTYIEQGHLPSYGWAGVGAWFPDLGTRFSVLVSKFESCFAASHYVPGAF